MKPEAEIRQALRQWIISRNPALQNLELSDDTPIIEQRILQSIQIIDFILFLETLREAPIELESLKPGVFRDINAIYTTFFGEPDTHAS